MCVRIRLYSLLMAERVEELDLGVAWNANAPDAILLTGDSEPTVLALRADFGDADQRCVVLTWTGCIYACMTPPNDEAISGHRLWKKGLSGLLWAGVVNGSALIKELERRSRVHPLHRPSRFEDLIHYLLPLKECVVEVVASDVTAQRAEGTTAEAAVRAHR